MSESEPTPNFSWPIHYFCNRKKPTPPQPDHGGFLLACQQFAGFFCHRWPYCACRKAWSVGEGYTVAVGAGFVRNSTVRTIVVRFCFIPSWLSHPLSICFLVFLFDCCFFWCLELSAAAFLWLLPIPVALIVGFTPPFRLRSFCFRLVYGAFLFLAIAVWLLLGLSPLPD